MSSMGSRPNGCRITTLVIDGKLITSEVSAAWCDLTLEPPSV